MCWAINLGVADTPENHPAQIKEVNPLYDIHIEGHQYEGKTVYVMRKKLKITNYKEIMVRHDATEKSLKQ